MVVSAGLKKRRRGLPAYIGQSVASPVAAARRPATANAPRRRPVGSEGRLGDRTDPALERPDTYLLAYGPAVARSVQVRGARRARFWKPSFFRHHSPDRSSRFPTSVRNDARSHRSRECTGATSMPRDPPPMRRTVDRPGKLARNSHAPGDAFREANCRSARQRGAELYAFSPYSLRDDAGRISDDRSRTCLFGNVTDCEPAVHRALRARGLELGRAEGVDGHETLPETEIRGERLRRPESRQSGWYEVFDHQPELTRRLQRLDRVAPPLRAPQVL